MLVCLYSLRERMTMKRTVSRSVLLLALLIFCAMPAGAAQKKTRSRKSGGRIPAAPAAVGPECPSEGLGRAGFRAFIDPRTGELREPTVEEAQALAAGARPESLQPESLEAIVHPDGMISVDLKGHFMQSLVAVRNPDGSLSMSCGPDTGKPAAISKPAPAPALEER
jgi:hypothetical protein